MGKKAGPNKESLEATRKIFLDIARKEFSHKGYYGASTGDIVNESGMARGSLYYHFGDKKGLFKAVYEETMKDMRGEVVGRIGPIDNAWDKFMTACLTVLDLCMRSEMRRIVVDVHTALTYRERFEILSKTLLEELVDILGGVIKAGYFKGHEPRTLMMMIFGIISESGRSFELSEDVVKTRKTLGDTFILFMEQARA
jgi:AcrR family transcriptional regulator